MKEQTKCYCGHTTYCDCGLEETKQDLRKYPLTTDECFKQETLEKYSERFDNDKSPIGNPETWGKRMVEEPKQETLEEVAKKKYGTSIYDFDQVDAFIEGAKWQQERSYSEEEMKSAFKVGFSIGYGSDVHAIDEKNRTCEEWFEQFKNK